MNTQSLEVKDAGFYGDIIRNVLREHRIESYSALAKQLNDAGVRHHRTGGELNKSLIANWATDRINTPNWFMRELGRVLKNDVHWWEGFMANNPMLSAPRAPMLKLRLDIADGFGFPDSLASSVEVPWFAATGFVEAAIVPDERARGSFSRGDLLVIDTTGKGAKSVDEWCVYAIRVPGANSAEFRKAEYDEEAGDVILRSKGKRSPDIHPADADIVGKVVVHYEKFRVETLPRGRFDMSGELFGESW